MAVFNFVKPDKIVLQKATEFHPCSAKHVLLRCSESITISRCADRTELKLVHQEFARVPFSVACEVAAAAVLLFWGTQLAICHTLSPYTTTQCSF